MKLFQLFKNKQIVFLLTCATVILVDIISKFYANTLLKLEDTTVLINKVLSLEKVYNTGAAFSILENQTFLLILIALITILGIIYYVFFFNKTKINFPEVIAFACICGGSIGNAIDRVVNAYVIDFIKLTFIDFPIFNFADVFINVGVIILVVSIFMTRNDK